MELSYNNLWKTLIDKDMKKDTLCQTAEMSTSTMSKMKRNEPVSLAIVLKICKALYCDIEDVVAVVTSNQRGE